MSVRDQALVAAEAADAEAQAAARREADDEFAAGETRRQLALETIRWSPLEEWFPGEQWDVMDYSTVGAAAGFGDGRDVIVAPEDRSVYLGLVRMSVRVPSVPAGQPGSFVETGKVIVHAVEQLSDTGMSSFNTGYSYWGGPEVKSAAAVGRWIKATEERRARG